MAQKNHINDIVTVLTVGKWMGGAGGGGGGSSNGVSSPGRRRTQTTSTASGKTSSKHSKQQIHIMLKFFRDFAK